MIKKAIYRPTDMATRYAGEKFVLIFQDTDSHRTIKIAQKTQKSMSKILNLPTAPMTRQAISLSIGVSFNYRMGMV